VKKPLLVIGLVLGGILSISFSVAGGTYAAYRDNGMKCADPVDLDSLSVELPEGALACRKTGSSEYVNVELLVEKPGALCFLTSGIAGCPSVVKNQLALMRSMEGAGWERTSSYDKSEISFARGKARASIRLRQDRYGEVAATMSLALPSTKIGKH
jgi:hypothetical protein